MNALKPSEQRTQFIARQPFVFSGLVTNSASSHIYKLWPSVPQTPLTDAKRKTVRPGLDLSTWRADSLLPPLSWAMRVRRHTARDIQPTKGQLLLQLPKLFWESEWWFMLANWFISRTDKHLFFFWRQMPQRLWREPRKRVLSAAVEGYRESSGFRCGAANLGCV